jgi:hypothetical protein
MDRHPPVPAETLRRHDRLGSKSADGGRSGFGAKRTFDELVMSAKCQIQTFRNAQVLPNLFG